MIRRTFILLDSVGYGRERLLWSHGIRSWDDFVSADKIKGISKDRKDENDLVLRNASVALKLMDSSFFFPMIPSKDSWRLYRHFQEEAVFLDIEATGIRQDDEIFMVGLFDGIETKILIKGMNLDFTALKHQLQKYKIILTYNGSSFDLPFMKKRYPDLLPQIPRIDLKHLCIRCGYKGGLKEVEKTLGIRRNPILEKLIGGDVYRLWRMHRASGDDYYLKLLVEYNEDDVINLKIIADHVIRKLSSLLLNNIYK